MLDSVWGVVPQSEHFYIEKTSELNRYIKELNIKHGSTKKKKP